MLMDGIPHYNVLDFTCLILTLEKVNIPIFLSYNQRCFFFPQMETTFPKMCI